MDKIRKVFSAQFANLISKSPTLMADIKRVRKWGYEIVRDKKTCGGSADIEEKRIVVGGCKLKCRIYVLAHEIGHVLNSRDKSLKKVSAHRATAAQYVYAEIRDEARAIRYAIERVQEIYAGLPSERDHFASEWKHLAKIGKWGKLMRAVKEAEVTDNKKSKTLWQYWADSYKSERASAARKRKQSKGKARARKAR